MNMKQIAIAGMVMIQALSMGIAQAGDMLGGSFTGKSSHETSGHVKIEKSGSGYMVVLQDDFMFDGAPDPKVVLGRKGSKERVTLSHLNANSGKQSYPVPASVDVSQFDEVWIWCKKYAVPLGYAPLN